MAERWKRCSVCKKDIVHAAPYWVCSVSTCNRSRTALVFCSVDCWEIHLPLERHREAWAVEKRADAYAERGASAQATGNAPAAGSAERAAARARQATASEPDDVLVVASKLKAYVRSISGLHTSDRVMFVLSDVLRKLCDEAIAGARREGRDVVLGRDVPASR